MKVRETKEGVDGDVLVASFARQSTPVGVSMPAYAKGSTIDRRRMELPNITAMAGKVKGTWPHAVIIIILGLCYHFSPLWRNPSLDSFH